MIEEELESVGIDKDGATDKVKDDSGWGWIEEAVEESSSNDSAEDELEDMTCKSELEGISFKIDEELKPTDWDGEMNADEGIPVEAEVEAAGELGRL